jgi:hypothetical protein
MSLQRIDPRFVLPRPVATAVVLGELTEWRRGLQRAGVHVSAGPVSGLDLVVAPERLAADAVAQAAEFVLLEGNAQRELARAGFAAQRLLLRPTRERPTLVLPVQHRRAAVYAVDHWSVVDRRWKVARRRAAGLLMSRQLLPSWASPVVTVGVRATAPPFFIEAARQFAVPTDGGWALTLGQGDVLSRNVFHVFPPDASEPTAVVKFARIADFSEPFDRDERGLAIAEAAGAVASGTAPRLLGRLEVAGVHASVETAAVGRRLYDVLLVPGGRKEKLNTIEAIAAWTIDIQKRTAAAPDALQPERMRFERELLSEWSGDERAARAVALLAGVPAVAQHNDLGSWNIIVAGTRFTVVDWESATRFAVPLWDLLYFLADALIGLDGRRSPSEHAAATIELFTGRHDLSQRLFAWVRRAVAALEIPRESVGPIAALCWLHHARSSDRRDRALAVHAGETGTARPALERVSELWQVHAALGWDWAAWQS